MSVEAGAGRTTHPWDNPETHESCSGVPRALCSYTTLQLPDEDVLLSKAFAPRVEVLEDGTEVPLELDLSVPPLAAPAGPRIEKQPPTRLVGGESFLSESDLNTLGQPQFYIDVSEMSGAAHTVSGNLASPASFAVRLLLLLECRLINRMFYCSQHPNPVTKSRLMCRVSTRIAFHAMPIAQCRASPASRPSSRCSFALSALSCGSIARCWRRSPRSRLLARPRRSSSSCRVRRPPLRL